MDTLKGRYDIQKTLGDRYGQKTYLARDRQTETFVVVKLILFNSELKWETVKLFEREANTLKSLDHPAIPKYLDYFDVETPDGKGFALVQSFIAADSLRQHVTAGRRFSESALKDIAREVLGVFSYLHSQQPPIIHRDIKPSNLLLSDTPDDPTLRAGKLSGEIFVVDFGSVQAVQSDGGTRTVVGTYGYMPPEQFGDRATPASDLYGLGATLIALATGQHPADLPQKNLRICFEDSVSLSPKFVQWLKEMTSPGLAERFSSAQAALAALDKKQPASKPKPNSLPTIGKPRGSKVSLTSDENQLEIIVPPKGFTLGLVPLSLFTIAWNLFLVNWYKMAFSMGVAGLIPGLFALIHLSAGVIMVGRILRMVSGQSVLKIDQRKISLRQQIFGLPYRPVKEALRENIAKIEKRKIQKNDGFETVSSSRRRRRRGYGNLLSADTALDIWVGNQKFVLPGDVLTEVEVEWLVDELQHWLDQPTWYAR